MEKNAYHIPKTIPTRDNARAQILVRQRNGVYGLVPAFAMSFN